MAFTEAIGYIDDILSMEAKETSLLQTTTKMMNRKSKGWHLLIIVFFILLSCQNKGKNGKPLDTPTSGEITVAADESLRPIIDAEVEAFEAIYKNAKINVIYGSEAAALNKLLADSARLAIVTRPLTEEEASVIEKQKIFPTTLKVGTGAVALVVNNDNPDSLISMAQLQALFRGEIDQWKQMNPKSPLNGIKVVFDHEDASSVRYMRDSVAKVAKLPPNSFAVASNDTVIDYVSQNKNALGLIGVSWISDNDHAQTIGFLNKIQVVALAAPGGSTGKFYKPFQAYIAQGLYPLTRGIYMISREARSGLGSGFMSFVASAKGQRVILKAGLVPATMPVRILEFSE